MKLLYITLGLFCGWLASAFLADLWQTITGTPVRCDAGEEEDALHICGDCGAELQIVRPGKYQCVNCEKRDHAQNPEHPFFLEWQRAEEERRIDEWIRRALNSE
jgi:hypothetical protein